MPALISIKQDYHSTDYIFAKQFDQQQDFDSFHELCKSRKEIGLFTACLITVRTNTLDNFLIDFFFPSLINKALKIGDIALKIIFIVPCLLLDICTLPIRLITLIPRYIANNKSPKEAHPLYQHLLAQRVDISPDTVYLKEIAVFPFRSNEDISPLLLVGKNFNFIEVPVNAYYGKEITMLGNPNTQQLNMIYEREAEAIRVAKEIASKNPRHVRTHENLRITDGNQIRSITEN